MDISKCQACGKPIRWVRTAATGKRIPLDDDPNPELGNVLLNRFADAVMFRDAAAAIKASEATTDEYMAMSSQFTAHMATCSAKPRATAPRASSQASDAALEPLFQVAA